MTNSKPKAPKLSKAQLAMLAHLAAGERLSVRPYMGRFGSGGMLPYHFRRATLDKLVEYGLATLLADGLRRADVSLTAKGRAFWNEHGRAAHDESSAEIEGVGYVTAEVDGYGSKKRVRFGRVRVRAGERSLVVVNADPAGTCAIGYRKRLDRSAIGTRLFETKEEAVRALARENLAKHRGFARRIEELQEEAKLINETFDALDAARDDQVAPPPGLDDWCPADLVGDEIGGDS